MDRITSPIFGDFLKNVKSEIIINGIKVKMLVIIGSALDAGKPNLYNGTAKKASIIVL
jgi:hypothetical protein